MKWKRIKCFLTGGHRLYDREIDKSWWFFNTFVITLK